MRWLMRLLRLDRHDAPRPPDRERHEREKEVVEAKLLRAESRWERQRVRVDPVVEEVERVQKMMEKRNARAH